MNVCKLTTIDWCCRSLPVRGQPIPENVAFLRTRRQTDRVSRPHLPTCSRRRRRRNSQAQGGSNKQPTRQLIRSRCKSQRRRWAGISLRNSWLVGNKFGRSGGVRSKRVGDWWEIPIPSTCCANEIFTWLRQASQLGSSIVLLPRRPPVG